MASNLKGQSPVRIQIGQRTAALPPVQILENIPTLHQILQEVVHDWHRVVEPYEARIAKGIESADYVVSQAFMELQPTLLKCLFSYVFFFVAADQAYEVLYASLNRANKAAAVKAKHAKPPQRSGLVEKARSIRNWSIAHFPSKKASSINADAAMSWTPMTLSKPNDGAWDLKALTFGGFRLSYTDDTGTTVQSRDLELQGLDALHQECLGYLETYDLMCCEYLANLHRALAVPGAPGA